MLWTMTATNDVTSKPDDDTEPEPRPRRRRMLIVAGGVLVVLALVTAWLLFGGEQAQQSSEEQARQRLGDRSAASSASRPVDAAPLTLAPPTGLYRYRGTGHEETSMPPLSAEQGPQMPATVTHDDDGCWVLQIDFNTHHWQKWTFCTADGELIERDYSTFTRRVLGTASIDNLSEFDCEPEVVVLRVDDTPGLTRTRSCAGSSEVIPTETVTAGSITVEGREPIEIGGQSVPAVHLRYDLTHKGAQNGTQTVELWLAADTGLVLRLEQQLELTSESPIGTVDYREQSELQLESITPT
jgi:hypothetical protein